MLYQKTVFDYDSEDVHRMFSAGKLSIKLELAFVLSIWVSIAFPACAADVGELTGFFTGMLANKLSVAFSLKEQQGHISGSYYYLSVGKDIPVQGWVDTQGAIRLDEYGEPGRVTGTWQGRIDNPNRISGTWRSSADRRKSLAFLLERIWSDDVPGEPEHREIISDGIGYRRVPIGKTGIQFPRLTRYRDQKILAVVNREIDKLTGTMRCEDGGDYKVKSAVTYAAKDIVSIYASASYYCGGPYPTNDANISMTFDLRTSRTVGFKDLFKDYEADKGDILRTIFSKQVARAESMARRPGKAPEPGGENVACESEASIFSMESLQDSDFAFNFSKEGLQVQPEWPHAIEACAERVTAPFQALKRFAQPEGILARVMAP